MKPQASFPYSAFKEKSVLSGLSEIFGARTYDADDIKYVRSSFFMSDFKSKGTAHCYRLSWVSASRMEDDNFIVTQNHVDVEDDHLLRQARYDCEPEGQTVRCTQDDLLREMEKMTERLKENALIESVYPQHNTVYMHDFIHFNVAVQVFDHSCSKGDIKRHIDLVENKRPTRLNIGNQANLV